MDLACFAQRQRPRDLDRLPRSSEQLPAGHGEVAACHGRELFRREREYDRTNPGPVNLARAHRTRLTTCVKHALAELVRRQLTNSSRNQVGLSVSRGIPICCDGVLSAEHDASIENQERSERLVPGCPSMTCQFDRMFREADVDVIEFHKRQFSPAREQLLVIVAQSRIRAECLVAEPPPMPQYPGRGRGVNGPRPVAAPAWTCRSRSCR